MAALQINPLFAAILGVSDYADDTSLTQESKEELKSLLMKVKEESEKAQSFYIDFRKGSVGKDSFTYFESLVNVMSAQ